MNGPIAQIVALTCHANAFLQGRSVGTFFPSNSTTQFCESIVFVKHERRFLFGWRSTVVAENPNAWFEKLKSEKVRGIRLTRTSHEDSNIPDRMAAAFVGGGGTWCMEVVLAPRVTGLWTAKWTLGDRNAANQRIWTVEYGRTERRERGLWAPKDLAELARELQASLHAIHAFAQEHDLGGFVECFRDAIDTIETSGARRYGYHQDLAPPGLLSGIASTLLDACQRAWVFGGMGSWNDLAFDADDQQTYADLSERLYQTINAAIAGAASSSFSPESL